jgi:hypothetical protein
MDVKLWDEISTIFLLPDEKSARWVVWFKGLRVMI